MPHPSPPATPTDYAGRGARNTATVDPASPPPGLYAETPESTGHASDGGLRDIKKRDLQRRASTMIRSQPLTSLAAALAMGAAAGILLQRWRR